MFIPVRWFAFVLLSGSIAAFSALPALGAVLQTEQFDTAAAAAANGWTLQNGVGNWGWQSGNSAGGNAGEARADSYSAGTQRWFADLNLEGNLNFSVDWQASGRLDFIANSASDGGMFFGFFNRNTSLQSNNQTVAGFLLVNQQLTLRFEHRPATTYLETSDFGLWVGDDHLFTLSFDADGGGTGVGRLTASLTRSADQSTTTRSLDIPASLSTGSVLNSFGFYAMDFAPGRPTPFDWVVDDLTYGPVAPIAPVAADDGPIAVIEGVAQIIPVGANDTNFTDPVTVNVTTPPTKGTITAVSAPGPAAGMTITYTANIGGLGADSFVYSMVDSVPAADAATVTLVVSPDTDGDGIGDANDNCTLVANAATGNVPGTSPPIPKYQQDSDNDGYGNACDGDLNNSGTVTTADYGLLRSVLGELASYTPLAAAADMNGSGAVTASDFGLLRALLGTSPGPSGLHP